MLAKLTYANVISTLCLFLVLGGGTAIALDGHNTVFSDDIKNGQVRTKDLAAGAIKVVTRQASVPVAAGSQDFQRVSCNAGERATGGGALWGSSPDNQNAMIDSYPEAADNDPPANGEKATQWAAEGFNAEASQNVMTVFVICLSS